VPATQQDLVWTLSYIIGGIAALAFIVTLLWWGYKTKNKHGVWIEDKQISVNKHPNIQVRH
jgi:hypothetical protein